MTFIAQRHIWATVLGLPETPTKVKLRLNPTETLTTPGTATVIDKLKTHPRMLPKCRHLVGTLGPRGGQRLILFAATSNAAGYATQKIYGVGIVWPTCSLHLGEGF